MSNKFNAITDELGNKPGAQSKYTPPDAYFQTQLPGYYLDRGLIWFGAYKRYIGIYPKTPGMEAAIKELSAY